MRRAILAGVIALAPLCADAEVKFASADGFLIEHRFTIAAPAAKVWEMLQHPERWWPADHTWSGKRENLSLVADAGGCFCERWDGGQGQKQGAPQGRRQGQARARQHLRSALHANRRAA